MQFEYIPRRVVISVRGIHMYTYFYTRHVYQISLCYQIKKIRPITYYATLHEFRRIVYVLHGMLIPRLVSVLLLLRIVRGRQCFDNVQFVLQILLSISDHKIP